MNMVSTDSSSTTIDTTNGYEEDDNQDNLTSKGLLKRDRYVATNRFTVREGKEAKFEQRWVKRKSRLATLQGFRYFHLMRRVTFDMEDKESTEVTYDGGNKKDNSNFGNYVSFTIWDKKSHFSAWRKGEAFKEAHGGTSLTAFVSTMVSSAFVLKGAPRPAFYDGLLSQSIVPDTLPEIIDGWRNIESDENVMLPPECFIACNQFYVPSENAAAFEQRWASRESKLKDCEGFVAFNMMRRDGQAKGHGVVEMDESEPTYLSTTIWENKASFDKWRTGNAFKQAHGVKSPNEASDSSSKDEKPSPPKPLWSKPPSPVFYEGALVISSADGA